MTPSKALLEDEPVILFSPVLAKAFGPCAALLIQQIHYWFNCSPKERDGTRWCFNTYERWGAQIGYSAREVRRTLKALESMNVIATGVYNAHKYDRTRWYRVNYLGLCERLAMRLGSQWIMMAGPYGQNGQIKVARVSAPIPEIPPENKSEIETGELTFACEQAGNTNTTPAGGKEEKKTEEKKEEGKKADVHTSGGVENSPPKPATVLEAYWQKAVTVKNPNKHYKQLTQKELHQLKHLANQLGPRTQTVIAFAVNNWHTFLWKVRCRKGLPICPDDPHVGLLLAHHDVALDMMDAEEPLAKSDPMPLPSPKPEPVPLKEKHKAEIEEMMARFAAAGEPAPEIKFNSSGDLVARFTEKELAGIFTWIHSADPALRPAEFPVSR